MKLIKIQYKKKGQLLTRVMKLLVEDDLTMEEIREEVLIRILDDLGVQQYSWEILEGDL